MAIAAQEGSQAEVQSEDLERKPLLSFRAILLMNFGFFGIQYSFGLQQAAINPIFQFLGADPAQMPLLNLAGPVTGLLIKPLISAMSDRTWSDRWDTVLMSPAQEGSASRSSAIHCAHHVRYPMGDILGPLQGLALLSKPVPVLPFSSIILRPPRFLEPVPVCSLC